MHPFVLHVHVAYVHQKRGGDDHGRCPHRKSCYGEHANTWIFHVNIPIDSMGLPYMPTLTPQTTPM